MKIEELTRKFTYNGVDLPDPGPAFNPEQVKDLYCAAYPDLANASIEGPERIGGNLTYSFRRAVGTKG